jgi:hypothetical protein
MSGIKAVDRILAVMSTEKPLRVLEISFKTGIPFGECEAFIYYLWDKGRVAQTENDKKEIAWLKNE